MSSTSPRSPENSNGPIATSRAPRDTASPVEMREFLAEMRGLEPPQIMGAGSEGNLASAMVTATVGAVVLMAALTLGPYAWKQSTAEGDKKSAAPVAEKQAASAGVAEPAGAEKDAAGNPVAGNPAHKNNVAKNTDADKAAGGKGPSSADPNQPVVSDKMLERLGVGEVKSADPNVNPLESKLDDLLDQAK